MREEERILELDRYEHGVMVNALNELRNDLIEDKQSTDAVDDLLIKTIDSPTRKVKRRSHDEAR